jgi:hypothetical protein
MFALKTKLRSPNSPSKSIARTLFYKPFHPQVNFALEDPLLLCSHPLSEKEGVSYSKYFGANSPLSSNASQFLERKFLLEKKFSELVQMDKSVILEYNEDHIFQLSASFLPSQKFLVPNSIASPFEPSQTLYFSESNLTSLVPFLEKPTDHLKIVFLPKISQNFQKINFSLLESIKEQYPFFLIIEDKHTFGLEGLNGFGITQQNSLADLLITAIPKSFGKMLNIFSGSIDLLDTLMEYSFKQASLFPPAAYLGLFDAFLTIIPTLGNRREALKAFIENLTSTFSDEITISNPLLSFRLSSLEEKNFFSKSLVDKGFLLPASSFTKQSTMLLFHLNYLLEEKSIHTLYEIKQNFCPQSVCESI